MSSEGRNRSFGECLGRGLCKADATTEVKQTVEGIVATLCLKKVARKFGLKLPFAAAIDAVVEERTDAKNAIDGLLKKI